MSDASDVFEYLGLGETTRRTFELMDVAEEVIALRKEQHPDMKQEIDRAFGILSPGHLISFSHDLYRIHCRELLDRVVSGGDTRQATDAEKMAAMSEASLRTPMSDGFTATYWKILSRRFPDLCAVGSEILEVPRESYPGQTEEIESELNRKLFQKSRVLS